MEPIASIFHSSRWFMKPIRVTGIGGASSRRLKNTADSNQPLPIASGCVNRTFNATIVGGHQSHLGSRQTVRGAGEAALSRRRLRPWSPPPQRLVDGKGEGDSRLVADAPIDAPRSRRPHRRIISRITGCIRQIPSNVGTAGRSSNDEMQEMAPISWRGIRDS